jgi:PAS domain S-box-containing protein
VRSDVQRTIETGKIILSQPIELIQGGQGVIARQAIYEGNHYWGLANIVVAVLPMLEDAGMLSAQNEMVLALKDQTGQIFYGPEDVFASDAVTYTIYLPEGSWELAGMPVDGWSNSYQSVLSIYISLGLILIIALTLLVYQFTRRYKYLSILVERRSRDLQESETQYRELASNALVGIFIMQNQVLQFGNQGLADLFGYESPEKIIGLHIRNLVAPESWEEFKKEVCQRESWQKINNHYRFKGIRADGNLIDIELLSVSIAHHGQPAVQGVLIDITKRVLINQKLRKSEEHFRSVIQTQRDLIYRYLSDGTITLANDAYCQFIGKPASEIFGTSLFETIASEDKEIVREHIESLSVKFPVVTHENINFNRQGESRWFEWTDLAIISESGEIVEYQATGRDITERVQAEQSLLLEKEKAQKYLEVAGVMILVINADQKVSLINKRGCQILGYMSDEILGANWFETCIPDRNREETIFIFSRLMADDIEPVEYFENHVLTKDGNERLIAWHNTILKDSSGMITGTLSSGEDITERVQAERELKQS